MRNRVRMRLDLGQQTGERHHFDDPQPGDEAVLAIESGDQPRVVVIALQAFEEGEIVLETHSRLPVQDVDRARAFGLVPLADFEVVEVVRRRDLDRAGPLLGIGIGVADDRDQAADERQADPLADQMPVTLVVRVHRHRRVAQHRLGPRGRDRDAFAGLLAVRVHDRILEVVEMPVRILRRGPWRAPPRRGGAVRARPLERALGLNLDDLQIGYRGLKLGVPIDEPFVLVCEPLAIELNEHLGDRAREALVEREALAAPVAGGAEALELRHDRSARFRLPRPHALDERLAAQSAPVGLLPLHEHALDDHLRRDAGMVDARLPQHVASVHAPIAAQDVLKRVVERVAHMQIAGDVRRRNHDAKRLRRRAIGAAGPERSRRLPKRGGAAFR